jgi:DNA-binding MarR family transcriptional regulator
LRAVVGREPADLPDGLPILHYGLFSRLPELPDRPLAERPATSGLPLAALICRAILAIAIAFEDGWPVSLAVDANVLQLLGGQGVRQRGLPSLSGVSKEAISMAAGFLQKRGLAEIAPDPAGGRSKQVRLTAAGQRAAQAGRDRLERIEAAWRERHGPDVIDRLRSGLEALVVAPGSPLLRGLQPYPDGWRAKVPPPQRLPRYPMVLHRGGFPDGS